MSIDAVNWMPEAVCLRAPYIEVSSIAKFAYATTCRTDFSSPGFCLVNVGSEIGSVAFRQLMVDIKIEMAKLHRAKTSKNLGYLSAARFDQQETTRPHLDGGPDECFLMLGYEPSGVDSQLEICDYSKCAFDMGLSPKEFLAQHNPMFKDGYDLLRPYSTLVPCFSKADYQIACINNSSAPYDTANPMWQGTLHTAAILTPDESMRRVINSTMIASVPIDTVEPVDAAMQREFVSTVSVRRRGYDKQHLEDDG